MKSDIVASQGYAPAEIPLNLFRPTAPLKCKVLENKPLTSPESPNDVRHLVFDIQDTDYWYLDGQSAGILPPGNDDAGKPHKLRLYSIASPAVGDDGNGKTFSLCVKRLIYEDPDTGEEKRGVCSNYLCDLKVGDVTDVTGPTGKNFLLPEVPDANMIMVATGTGIAPFRGFLYSRYNQRPNDKGETWLFFGAPYRSDYLYADELKSFSQHDNYHLVTAFSREEQTPDGRKMYVQDRLYEHRQVLFDLLLQPNTYFYICGLRGMEKGILEALNTAATERGLSWDELFAKLNAEKRWRIEVY
jgi:ferredoxin--NADP+ reductase